MTCPLPEMKSVFVLTVSSLKVLLQLEGRGEGGGDLFCAKCVNIAISVFISVRLIFVQVQVIDTETHRSDNLQIEIMSVTSVYVDKTAW